MSMVTNLANVRMRTFLQQNRLRDGTSVRIIISHVKISVEEDKDKRVLECEPPTTINHKAPETNYAFNQLDEALRYTRPTSVAANPSTPTLVAPSVVFSHRQSSPDRRVRRPSLSLLP